MEKDFKKKYEQLTKKYNEQFDKWLMLEQTNATFRRNMNKYDKLYIMVSCCAFGTMCISIYIQYLLYQIYYKK